MASPLSPARDSCINNRATPPSKRKYDQYEVRTYTTESRASMPPEDDFTQNSSPFVSNVVDDTTSHTNMMDQENVSPAKSRHSRVISGTELSPLKILSEQRSSVTGGGDMGPPASVARNQRKVSPVTRFPVKISPSGGEGERATKERKINLEDAIKENDGLKHAIKIFEDDRPSEASNESPQQKDGGSGDGLGNDEEYDEAAGPDDTMASTFSTFSVVPSMTLFAKLGQSPNKSHGFESGPTPRAVNKHQQLHHRDSVRPPTAEGTGNTSNLLMDFTEQLRNPKRSPIKQGNLSPSRTMPNVSDTPSRQQLTNLIDFDIPPMPTPRSLPSITPRELESLKSGFLSEISSLKATLSGKEAEVQSLKKAVGDAETRVGESMEQLREQKALMEQQSAEKDDWEKRSREMESVLRKVRDEILTSQKEREDLEEKLDESEKRREAAEMLHQEAESKMAGMRAGKESEKSSSPEKKSAASSNKEVEIAVERVARELHALYKGKHETKVAALKKSYESRWEKKVKELETRLGDLGEENEKLRIGRTASPAKTEQPDAAEAEARKAQAAKDSAAMKELNADVQRLEAVVTTVKQDNAELRVQLEKERVEKGELVQLAEEMMSMQSFVGPQRQQQQQQHAAQQQQQRQRRQSETPRRQQYTDPAKTPRASVDSGIRSNIARSGGSGLRAPGSAIRAPQDRGSRISGGLPRPGGARSGIMSSIEKMGSYRGRAAAAE